MACGFNKNESCCKLLFFLSNIISRHKSLHCTQSDLDINALQAQSVHTHTQTHSWKYLLLSFPDTHSWPVLQGHKTALIRVLWQQQVVIRAASWPSSTQRKNENSKKVSRPLNAKTIRLKINNNLKSFTK